MTQTTKPAPRPSLYTAIGGRDAVAAAVDGLYARLLSDELTARFFAGMDMLRLNGHMRLFLTAALSGNGTWGGRDLGAAHAHLGITDADFDRVAGHLAAVLTDLGVEDTLAGAVLDVIGPLRASIVSRSGV